MLEGHTARVGKEVGGGRSCMFSSWIYFFHSSPTRDLLEIAELQTAPQLIFMSCCVLSCLENVAT